MSVLKTKCNVAIIVFTKIAFSSMYVLLNKNLFYSELSKIVKINIIKLKII